MLNKIGVSILGAALLSITLSGCQRNESPAGQAGEQKGAAEKAGRQLDQAAAEAAKHLNTVAERAGKGLEKAGETLQREAKDAQERHAQKQDARPQEPQK